MKYISCDPGLSGFFAVIDTESDAPDKLTTYPMPRIGDEVDARTLRDILIEISKGEHHLVMEEVHSVPLSSAKSNFNFGRNVGVVQGLLHALNIKHSFMTPKEWQKLVWRPGQMVKKANGKNDTKAESFMAAQRWFPNTKFLKSKDGEFDSALIAMANMIKYGK